MSHPSGIYTLFFTEMWERMSYYGMRALLVLFMVDQIQHGGMGLDDRTATAIYGLYTAAVYLAALPGGWIGDRLLGAKGGVWYGGIIIACGHLVLALHSVPTFAIGLMLVAAGSGLLKSNMSALVGELYPEGGARRDVGFTLFYMGVNLGAFVGPLLCSYLGENHGWRWGFGVAAVGMLLGLLQFRLFRRHLDGFGERPHELAHLRGRDWRWVLAGVLAVVMVTTLCITGVWKINPVLVAERSSIVLVLIALAYFAWAAGFAGLSKDEKKRVALVGVLFVASALFWAGFEQVGSSFTLFAERFTMRQWGSWEMPVGWFQSVNPLLIIALAPLMAAGWHGLERQGRAPSIVTKLAWGLLLLALGFLVASIAAKRAVTEGPVWPSWLFTVYLLHTVGELCLSPVGLSAVTKLAPRHLTGQLMGIWFLGTAVGNLLAGIFAGHAVGDAADAMPGLFMQAVLTSGGAGLVLWVCSRPLQRLAPQVR